MTDLEILAGRLEAQDRLIGVLMAALLEARVISAAGLAEAVQANAIAAATGGNQSAATILRHRAKALAAANQR